MIRLDQYDDVDENEEKEDEIAMCFASWQKNVLFFFLSH